MVRRSRRRVGYLLLLTASLPWGCGNIQFFTASQSAPGTTTTIILVRHGERDPAELDPPINDEGVLRSQALRDALAENGVTAIYIPDVLRNRQTIEPLTAALDVPVIVIPTVDIADTKALANRLVNEWLTTQAGGVVLWVGNTGPVTETQEGNLAELYKRLGGVGRAPNHYSDMYIAVVPEEGATRFIETSYGGASSQDP